MVKQDYLTKAFFNCAGLVCFSFAVVLLTVTDVSGQRVTGQSAAEAFSRGDYTTSYKDYMSLLESFPRDPVYLYGAGVSLINLSHRPEEASGLLERALKHGSSIRSAPPDARFYLARAYHLQGRYDEATGAYNSFASDAGRREARAYGVPDLIRQCADRNGALPVSAATELPVTLRVMEELLPEPVIMVRPPDPLDPGKDSLLHAALTARFISDSLSVEAKILEGSLSGANTLARKEIPERIREMKYLSIRSQIRSDSLLALAGLPVKAGNKAGHLNEPANAEPPVEVKEAIAADTLAGVLTVEEVRVISTLADDTVRGADDTSIQAVEPAAQGVRDIVTSVFRLHESPYYSVNVPVRVSSSFPAGFYYSIQLAVFRNPVMPSFFKGLFPIFGIKKAGSELTTYYTGLFRKSEDASKALQTVRSEGFKDAFTVIYMDGKQVSAERGAIFEKDWSVKALTVWDGVIPKELVSPVQRDTVPPTLLFRVEVLRSQTPVTEQQYSELMRIAAGRGLEIMNPATGLYVYIVGKFLTFESALAYADLLIRNGYRDARVAAWLGNREIPLETALKFFDRK